MTIAVSDFNGDGKADLTVSNAAGVFVLPGNGDGSFGDPAFYGGIGPVNVADFNGDGRTDLLIANYAGAGVTVLLGATDSIPFLSSTALNSASPNPGSSVAPGSLATVYGSFPDLTGLAVHFDALNAPVVATSSYKVTFQVPWELNIQSKPGLSIQVGGQRIPSQAVHLQEIAPAIFSTNGLGTGQAAVYDSSNRLVDNSNPAVAGSTVVQILCTGLGSVTNQPADGLPAPADPPSLTTQDIPLSIGNATAKVLSSALVPGSVGIYQISALVPANASKGPAVPVSIFFYDTNSPTISVK
jgi:uncharacterized protein (TIGR03437 family)